MAALAAVPCLTSLNIPLVDVEALPALAALAPRLRHLRLSPDPPPGYTLTELLLPCSWLGGLQALEAAWEALADTANFSCLTGLTRLSVNFKSSVGGWLGCTLQVRQCTVGAVCSHVAKPTSLTELVCFQSRRLSALAAWCLQTMVMRK